MLKYISRFQKFDPAAPGDIIFSDVGGEIEPQSARMYSHYHLDVDGYSRFMWITLLKGAPSGKDRISDHQSIATQFKHPRVMHVDGGADYRSTAYQEYCRSKEVKLTYSTPHHHDELGRAERQHRTLWEAARAVISSSGCPPQL